MPENRNLRELWRWWSTDPLFKSNWRRRRATLLPVAVAGTIVVAFTGDIGATLMLGALATYFVVSALYDIRRELRSTTDKTRARARCIVRDVLVGRSADDELSPWRALFELLAVWVGGATIVVILTALYQ